MPEFCVTNKDGGNNDWTNVQKDGGDNDWTNGWGDFTQPEQPI